MKRNAGLSMFIAVTLGAGCGDGSGRVQVFAQAEDTIVDGIAPGVLDEQIKDGWTVAYEKFLITVGNFRASRSANTSDRLSDPKVYVLDMKSLPSSGFGLALFENVAAVRWDRVGFDLPNAGASALQSAGLAESDFNLMRTGGYSLFFEATLTKVDGQSCRSTAPTDCVARTSLTVRWGLKAGTSFDDCAPPMGDSGFAVPSGGTVQVKPTIHGDHWFFNNMTQGAEITARYAQWIVNADLNRDGETTLDELRLVRASDLFPSPRYNLSGALIPITTAYDFLEAQARTLGDFQGQGECPTRRLLP